MVIDFEADCKVVILGATGSIGLNTIDVLESSEKRYSIEVVTGNNNIKALADIAKRVKAKYAVTANNLHYEELSDYLSDTNINVSSGSEAINEAVSLPSDVIVVAIVGYACLEPVMIAVKKKCKIALANKEVLVCAGSLIMQEAEKSGAEIIPVDSEHSAVFQMIYNSDAENIEKIILTASGGVCRGLKKQDLKNLTPEKVIKHPNWNMGAKISVDSSTMINKGLEVIEAYHLFPVEKDQVEAVLHYESIVHAIVRYRDGSLVANMSEPDMRLPISVALNWPDRKECHIKPLDFSNIKSLNFDEIDSNIFPAFFLSKEALRVGNNATIALNVANEVAVDSFLSGNIAFSDISGIIEEVLSETEFHSVSNIEDVFESIEQSKANALFSVRKKQKDLCFFI